MPTKAEIQARGKSDQLCKSFIRLQTSWFVLRCIAHTIGHLPVNHLEIVTLAYTAKNFVIYIFWWNKPLNVNQSIRVFPKSEPPLEMQPRARETISEVPKSTWEAIGKGLGTILTLIGKRMPTWVATCVAITAIPLLIIFFWQTWTSIILCFFFALRLEVYCIFYLGRSLWF